MAKSIPSRPEGWKFAGAAGEYHVWHAGKNDYRITDGAAGDVVRTRQHFGRAFEWARQAADARRFAEKQF